MKVSGAARHLAGGLLAVCVWGCGAQNGVERYVPSEATARRALDAVLLAWKAGSTVEGLTLSDPPVSLAVADSGRRPGQRLVEYEILGEVAAEGPRSFAVRLFLDGPREELEVCYYVLGIDPLWVFRQKDFEMLTHWDHSMPPEAPANVADGLQP